MNWPGLLVLVGLLGLAIETWPWGLLILAGLARLFWRSWPKR